MITLYDHHDGNRAGYMNGRTDIGRRINGIQQACDFGKQVVVLHNRTQLQAVGKQGIDYETDGHTAEHDKAQVQKILTGVKQKIAKGYCKHGEPCKIRNYKALMKGNPVVQRTVYDKSGNRKGFQKLKIN